MLGIFTFEMPNLVYKLLLLSIIPENVISILILIDNHWEKCIGSDLCIATKLLNSIVFMISQSIILLLISLSCVFFILMYSFMK